MLLVDDNMLKLSKMQETLLERIPSDRQENLKKYANTVKEIDKAAFLSLLNMVDQFDKHNHTLEEELQLLEQIKEHYEQLYEKQLNFKRVCELYGKNQLQLSDLSEIDISYIETRITIISGYLINLKNIESNKERLQELNNSLIKEEKNDEILKKRLIEYEEALRNNFLVAEGRFLVNEKIEYVNVISEYEKLGYDFKKLLDDSATLENELKIVTQDKADIEDKMQAAEVCYNSVPNSESKQILNEIKEEFFNIKYRLIMLKIVKLLSNDYNNYDLFKEKREKLLDLINYRVSCLEKLGISISIDPFSRTKLNEQLDTISSLKNNTSNINKIKKEIAYLSGRIEEMIEQNNTYMISINDIQSLRLIRPKNLNKGIGDIDISNVTLNIDDYFSKKEILDNQVVSLKQLPIKFNITRAIQKTRSVVRRCNEMVNGNTLENKNDNETTIPNLVIVPQLNSFEQKKDDGSLFNDLENESLKSPDIDKKTDDTLNEKTSIFETYEPFISNNLFTDRTDDIDFKNNSKKSDLIHINLDKSNKNDDVELFLDKNSDISADEMPDAFWVTQEDVIGENTDDEVLSFDEQINALLANDDIMVKKLAA